MEQIVVIGGGTMGNGIAHTAAASGFDTTLIDVSDEFLQRAVKTISGNLQRGVDKGKMTAEEKETILGRIKTSTDIDAAVANADIVIEAIIENLDAKKQMFSKLDAIVKKDAIFATNTSSISVTEVMTATQRQDRFIGLHFFNPVPLMKLVEVVRTIATSNEVFNAAFEFGKKLGKVPVKTSDKTGFIVNRLLVPYMLDAIRAYEEGVGSIADIDLAMKLGCGYPMGPFTLLDFVGLDTTYYITHVMFDEFKERRFAAPALLKRMVMAGWYGKKSGKGFYDWSTPEPTPQDAALKA